MLGRNRLKVDDRAANQRALARTNTGDDRSEADVGARRILRPDTGAFIGLRCS